jgi:type IV pilus assembly protein PilA
MDQNRTRSGFSLIGVLIVVATSLILAVIAIPKLHQNSNPGQETVAIRQVGIINTAETQYYSQFGKFAVPLAELGARSTGPAGPNGSDLIPGELALGKKSGFIFTVRGAPSGYSVTAVPEAFGSSGRRCFYSDQTNVIRENWGPEPATAASRQIR